MTSPSWPKTEFASRLKVAIPLIQAPMAGGATTPELVAAVSNTGAVGSLAAGMMQPEELRKKIREIRRLTRRPFNVNLQIMETPRQTISIAFIEKLKEYERSVGFALSMELETLANLEKQASVLLEEEIPIVSFVFGLLPPSILKEFHKKQAVVLGTATHPKEALALQEAGVDYIVCQGREAGGHRGTFMGGVSEGVIPTLELINAVRGEVKKPLIASGGIMNGKQVRAALHAGAEAVQMGTAFLCCTESGLDPACKNALLQEKERKTVLSRAYSGKWARCVENQFTREMASIESDIPPYPLAQFLTKPLRKAAIASDNLDFIQLYAGEHFRECEPLAAQELIARLTLEIQNH